jgi:hypothetical protein
LTAKLTAIPGDTPLSRTINPNGENRQGKERRAVRTLEEAGEMGENGLKTGVL